jgi:transglutaminase-like putative cysteine protease
VNGVLLFPPYPEPPIVALPSGGGTVTGTIPGYTGPAQPPVTKTTIDYTSGLPTAVQEDPKSPSTVPEPYPLGGVQNLPKKSNWSYRQDNLAVVGNANLKANTQYTVQSWDLPKVLTADDYVTTPVTDQDVADFQLAADLATGSMPENLKAQAESIVAGAKDPVDEAMKLQDYFQDPNRFTYTTAIPDNQTGDEAIAYLLDERQGYCQTFAMTMAAMARELGIPARVDVGFTPGKADAASGLYSVRMHDYHAWPELWFHGLGWLRFEPTVGIGGNSAGGHGLVPEYGTAAATQNPSSSASSSAPNSAANPSNSASAGCPVQQRRLGLCGADNGAGTAVAHKPFGSLGWFGAVIRFFDYWLFGGSTMAIVVRFLLLAALLVACVPMVLRLAGRRRRGRIATGRASARGPEPDDAGLDWENAESGVPDPAESPERARVMAAWAEVRDSATDLGYAWPSSETPRQSAERIIKQAHLSRSAQDAMNRVTRLTERAHYAPTLRKGASGVSDVPARLFDDVRTIRSGLAEPVNRRTRFRAAVLPPSTLAALRERRDDLTGRTYERVQRAGARLRPGGRGSRGGRAGAGAGGRE